eukprot:3780381-Pyramimonas_sp.AAC.1
MPGYMPVPVTQLAPGAGDPAHHHAAARRGHHRDHDRPRPRHGPRRRQDRGAERRPRGGAGDPCGAVRLEGRVSQAACVR